MTPQGRTAARPCSRAAGTPMHRGKLAALPAVPAVVESGPPMGRNQELRKKIAGHRNMIAEHLAKVQVEKRRSNPDWNLVAYWENRILAVEQKIVELEKRLARH